MLGIQRKRITIWTMWATPNLRTPVWKSCNRQSLKMRNPILLNKALVSPDARAPFPWRWVENDALRNERKPSRAPSTILNRNMNQRTTLNLRSQHLRADEDEGKHLLHAEDADEDEGKVHL